MPSALLDLTLQNLRTSLALPLASPTITARLHHALAIADHLTFTKLIAAIHTSHQQQSTKIRRVYATPFPADRLSRLRASLIHEHEDVFLFALEPALAAICFLPVSEVESHIDRWIGYLSLRDREEGEMGFLKDVSMIQHKYRMIQLNEVDAHLEEETERYHKMGLEVNFRLQQNLETSSWMMVLFDALLRVIFVMFAAWMWIWLGSENAFVDGRWSDTTSGAMLAVVMGVGMWGFGVVVGQVVVMLRILMLVFDEAFEIRQLRWKVIWRPAVCGILAMLVSQSFRVDAATRSGRTILMTNEKAWRTILVIEAYAYGIERAVKRLAKEIVCLWSPPSHPSAPRKRALRNGQVFGNRTLSFQFGLVLLLWMVWIEDARTLGTAGLQEAERDLVWRLTLQCGVIFMAGGLGRQMCYKIGFEWMLLSDLVA